MLVPTNNKKEVEEWFEHLRDLICDSFESIEKEYQNNLLI